jgi:hypothetical protein
MRAIQDQLSMICPFKFLNRFAVPSQALNNEYQTLVSTEADYISPAPMIVLQKILSVPVLWVSSFFRLINSLICFSTGMDLSERLHPA